VETEATARARREGGRRKYTTEERERLVEEYRAGGGSPRDFAGSHGIAYSTFTTWLRVGCKKAKVDPRFSRRFTPEERRAAVEAFLKSGRRREDFARLWGCSPSSLDKWVKRYRDEGPKGLETRVRVRKPGRPHPRRVSDAVREIIVQVARENTDFGATRIADHLMRFCGVKLSPGGVRKILRERGVPPQPFPKRRPRPKSKLPRRFERSRAGELWQSDITSFVLRRQGRRVYLTVFLDDFSRYVVAWQLATHQRTPLVTEALLEGIARFGKPKEVLTDQGRQYFAWRGKSGFQKLLAKEGIAHVVSRAHHPETLGKCERLWKTVGEEFWDRAAPQDLDDARRRLAHWFCHYNHFRPHQGIGGLVPADRFFGAESAVREALEKECSAHELRRALDEAPRKSVYLIGKIGDQEISLHGERGRLLIDTPDGGRREFEMDALGIERRDEEKDDDGDDTEDGNGRIRTGNGPQPPTGPDAAHAGEPQADELSQCATPGLAGAGALGERTAGAAGAGALRVHADPRVLARQEEQERGGAGAGGDAAPGVAAQPAGAVGDDGGTPAAAPAPSEPGGLRGSGGGLPGGAPRADRPAREGAGQDGGPGAGPEDCPVDAAGLGVSPEGRKEPCTQEEPKPAQEDATPESCERQSEPSSARNPRRRRWWHSWLSFSR
jgi:transposase InsO family protein